MPSFATGIRHLRPFISSTFLDMKAERDFLVNFTFPALRRKCESRGIIWGYVDLRWGISKEGVAEGKMLPVCLKEIRRSHPVFISILGERYGSYPGNIGEDLLVRERWLKEYKDRSVTELEIQAAALSVQAAGAHALFYFRDPHVIEELPKPMRTDHYSATADEAFKLTALKERIRASGHSVRDNFRSPQELGTWVEEDLSNLIDRLVPPGENVPVRQQQSAEQEAFILSRSEGYIRNHEMFLALDHHATTRDDWPVLVLHGDSGLGKTSLLANWSREFQREYPDYFVFAHFVGVAERSGRWQSVVQRLLWELQATVGAEESAPANDAALRKELPRWLEQVASHRPAVIVVDALNQIEDTPGALDLAWLPHRFPPNVRVMLSTLGGRALEAAKVRKWALREMPALDPKKDEVGMVARRYLEGYGKADGSQIHSTI